MADRFDVAIVGAGSAGSVLAARLSENPARRVVVLERGGTTPTRRDVDVERIRGHGLAPYHIGTGLGGSSAVNAMLATRAPRDDYDAWERDFGCDGWSWRDVAPFFEGVLVPVVRVRPQDLGEVDRALVESANAEHAELTWDGTRRITAAEAYLSPARFRPNLAVRADTTVDRVVLDENRAMGVLIDGGEVIEAATVVVCAGAIASPQLLLRSGVELPGVGRGLKDHPSVLASLRLHDPSPGQDLVAATLVRDGDVQVVPLNFLDDRAFGGLVGGLMRSYATGSVDAAGLARFNHGEDERDAAALAAVARRLEALADAEPVARIASLAAVDTDSGAMYHAGCTCRMGSSTDESAVVDIGGRVHGHEGLLVCDASIFPELPRANPYLTVLMVAEKVAAGLT